jgi:translation initiation factor 1 (eIF-1/SUI1)
MLILLFLATVALADVAPPHDWQLHGTIASDGSSLIIVVGGVAATILITYNTHLRKTIFTMMGVNALGALETFLSEGFSTTQLVTPNEIVVKGDVRNNIAQDLQSMGWSIKSAS